MLVFVKHKKTRPQFKGSPGFYCSVEQNTAGPSEPAQEDLERGGEVAADSTSRTQQGPAVRRGWPRTALSGLEDQPQTLRVYSELTLVINLNIES